MITAFYEYLAKTAEDRKVNDAGRHTYTGAEFEAFAAGWEAYEIRLKNINKLRLTRLLDSLLGDHELADKWWARPNKAFDNRTPEDVYKYDSRRVQDYIYQQFR